jgi:hypothetical protein
MIRDIFSHYGDIEEWRLGDAAQAAAKGYPRQYDAGPIDDYGIVFMDVVVEQNSGALYCHEVNGPNAVGSDALTGDSVARAQNEARQTLQRIRDFGYLRSDGSLKTQLVTMHAHQHWKAFRTGGEFYPRVLDFADALQALLPNVKLTLRAADDVLDDEGITILSGDVPQIAARMRVDAASHGFICDGRPVVFAGNPNLLPELVRTGKLQREGTRIVGADFRIFHGWRLLPIAHDRTLQQSLLRGTNIVPISSFEAMSIDDAFDAAKKMLGESAVVLKPNGCSGGAGIHVVAPEMQDDEIRRRIEAVLSDGVAKYGPNSETTLFPIRGFPFVRSTLFPMPDGGHTWDLRIAVMFEPGSAFVYPVSLRIAPDAYDPQKFQNERDQWVSNVTGRQVTYLKSCMDDDVLSAVGLTEEKLENAFAAAVIWTIKAWDRAVRDDGAGAVYEDLCEEESGSFYPWQKFST